MNMLYLLTVKFLQDLCIMEYGNNPYAEMVHKKSITSTLIKCTNGMFALVQAFMFLSFKSIPGICTHVCKGF